MQSAYFASANRNKKSVAVDITSKPGSEVFLILILFLFLFFHFKK